MLAFVGLEEHAKKKPKALSGGMQRRLNIGCALVHKPKLLIMDEPTVGIDPQSRNHILEAVKKLRQPGQPLFTPLTIWKKYKQFVIALSLWTLAK